MSKTYSVELTGAQLRILHENIALILNDPDWPNATAERDALADAHETIITAWRTACQAESTRAVHHSLY
jgi:hypothetical protein